MAVKIFHLKLKKNEPNGGAVKSHFKPSPGAPKTPKPTKWMQLASKTLFHAKLGLWLELPYQCRLRSKTMYVQSLLMERIT